MDLYALCPVDSRFSYNNIGTNVFPLRKYLTPKPNPNPRSLCGLTIIYTDMLYIYIPIICQLILTLIYFRDILYSAFMLKNFNDIIFIGWTAFKLENIRKYLKIQEDGRKSANSASAGKFC